MQGMNLPESLPEGLRAEVLRRYVCNRCIREFFTAEDNPKQMEGFKTITDGLSCPWCDGFAFEVYDEEIIP